MARSRQRDSGRYQCLRIFGIQEMASARYTGTLHRRQRRWASGDRADSELNVRSTNRDARERNKAGVPACRPGLAFLLLLSAAAMADGDPVTTVPPSAARAPAPTPQADLSAIFVSYLDSLFEKPVTRIDHDDELVRNRSDSGMHEPGERK
jgi:hypothetical protein